MQNPFPNLNLVHPVMDEMPAVLDFMILCDIADYGESDSSIEDLQDTWSDLDLEKNVWLALTPEKQIIGYAAVTGNPERIIFDFYVHPTLAPRGLAEHLLTLCEARTHELVGTTGKPITAIVYTNMVNKTCNHAAEALGYELHTCHYGMRISFDAPPSAPTLPDGITLRNAVAGQDDQMIYEHIQTAFERPGRVRPSFESWRHTMMEASNSDLGLWFLAFHGEELAGAILCFDYPQYGWVRQLGVKESWRRRGLGSALLQYMFRFFYDRGHRKVGLAVDSKNPRAIHVYETIGMKPERQYAEYHKLIQ